MRGRELGMSQASYLLTKEAVAEGSILFVWLSMEVEVEEEEEETMRRMTSGCREVEEGKTVCQWSGGPVRVRWDAN